MSQSTSSATTHSSTSLRGAVVLVTGANGGLGEQFVREALDRGAVKVYASARSPRDWADPRVVPLALDVTDDASVTAAVAAAGDTTVVVNNAGIAGSVPIATGPMAQMRAIFEVDYFGAVAVARAFAPVLAANGGGVLLNVHSVLSWIGLSGAYSAAKAALWSATNSLRLELAGDGTRVIGLHLGYTDTAMARHAEGPKNDPLDVVRTAYDGLKAGELEILADDISRTVKAGLSGPLSVLYPSVAPVPASA